MVKLNSHKDLLVWQKSMGFITDIYQLTNRFPNQESYGLTSQIRRSAISIPSNISEGYQRNTLKEYIQFLYIARGSAADLETQLIIAKNLSYLTDSLYQKNMQLLIEINKMLNGLINKLQVKLKTNS